MIAALAVVSCTASADISADLTYISEARSNVIGTAAVSPQADRTTFGGVSVLGESFILAIPQHTQAIFGDVLGQSKLLAYSLRTVGVSCDITCSADFTAIPASTLGAANILASASLSGELTPILSAKGAIVAEAGIVTQDALAIRQVEANLDGSASLYIECGINGVFEAYANVAGTSDILVDETGLVIKTVGSLLYGTAYCSGEATQEHRSHANSTGYGSLVALGQTIRGAQSSVDASGELSADIQYHRMAQGTPLCTAELVVNLFLVSQTHQGEMVGALGQANLMVEGTRVTFGAGIPVYASAECTGKTTYIMRAAAAPYGEAEVVGLAGHFLEAQAIIQAKSVILPIGYNSLMAPGASKRTFVRPRSLRIFVRSGTPTFERN